MDLRGEMLAGSFIIDSFKLTRNSRRVRFSIHSHAASDAVARALIMGTSSTHRRHIFLHRPLLFLNR